MSWSFVWGGTKICFLEATGRGQSIGTSSSSISGSLAIGVRARLADMRLFACFCFLVLLQGNVIGGLDGLSHNTAVVGDQKMGRVEFFQA